MLRDVFGMEMVELPLREKVTLQQKRGRLIVARQYCVDRADGILQRRKSRTKRLRARMLGSL
jgi:hypothetical protein